jgi:hypothetical protein
MQLINADLWCSTAATDGLKFYYNSRFIMMLKPKEVEFLVWHEVLHVVYDHMGRRGNRDPQMWNIADDYAVNADLKRHKVGEFIKTVPCLYETKYDGKSAEENIELTMRNSIVAYGVRDEDHRLVCIYGVGHVPRDSAIGLIWFLATDLIEKNTLIIARHSKSELARISRNFVLVYNYVCSRNITTINWLGRMGFKEVRRLENWRSTGVDFILLAYRAGE